jgi:beta-lactamase superfamily II metal-dependent hydrolase
VDVRGGLTLDVLAPSMPFLADTGDDVNENSIVVMLRYRNYCELFMGEASEASLLAADAPVIPSEVEGQPKIWPVAIPRLRSG